MVTVKLSSAGLIYKHFGIRALKTILGDTRGWTSLQWAEVYLHIYDNFVEELDGEIAGIL